MNDTHLRLGLCFVILAVILSARLQAAPPNVPSPPHLPSLAEALAAMPDASIHDGSVVLTLQPNQVMPLPPSLAEDTENPVQTPDTIAARYGRSLQIFSHVLALAPPTMTVLNTDPILAEAPLGILGGQHPETYLLGLLTPEQLRQAGTVGLAYTDMTPDQQSLMHALLPEPLEIVPVSASDHHMDTAERAAFDAQIKKISGNELMTGLRFHAYLTGDFYVHAPVGFGIGDTRELIQTTGAYKLPFSGYGNMEAMGKTAETVLRAEVSNSPKAGDLLWNRRDLEHTVSVQGVKTVDELTSRLVKATGLELYADPHYGPLEVLTRGDLKARQPAGDLMQALALCACGTWRQVGPAYVLTDDLQGLGTRQAFLSEIGQVWSNRLSEAGKEAGGHLQALDWMHSLSFVPGDIGALSPEQINAIQKEAGTNEGTLPWKSLPPALQDHLRDVFLHYGDQFPHIIQMPPDMLKMGDDMRAAAGSLVPNTPVDVTLNLRLGVELPNTGTMMLYGDYKVQPPKPDPGSAAAKTAEPDRPSRITLDKPVRGLLCAPKTPEEAQAVIAKMGKMGLNTLFLDVFTNGRTYFPNSILQPASDASGHVLQAALDAGRAAHIPVYAVIDTLCWRKDSLTPHPLPWPGGYAEDIAISGETLDHLIQRRCTERSFSQDYDHPRHLLAGEGTESWASPLDPAGRTSLTTLVQMLAATPGLAGLVFQDTVPPGYSGDRNLENLDLGYTPGNRLAYLRAAHIDPVDLCSGFGDSVNVFVGGEDFFGNYDIRIPTFAFSREDYAAWAKWRESADRSLLASCQKAARHASPALPLLVRSELSSIASFDPWTDLPQSSLPAGGSDERTDSQKITIHSILCIPFGPDERAHPESFIGNARIASGQGWGKGAGGELFDLVNGGAPADLLDALDKLTVFLNKPQQSFAASSH